MEKVVVLTAAHKSFDQLGLEGYLPVQVGAALAAQDLGFQRDDEGDNISEKNPQYCELTAQYWAWKNLTDAQIMGLVHYRRYFTTDLYAKNWKDAILTADQIRQLLRQYTSCPTTARCITTGPDRGKTGICCCWRKFSSAGARNICPPLKSSPMGAE